MTAERFAFIAGMSRGIRNAKTCPEHLDYETQECYKHICTYIIYNVENHLKLCQPFSTHYSVSDTFKAFTT